LIVIPAEKIKKPERKLAKLVVEVPENKGQSIHLAAQHLEHVAKGEEASHGAKNQQEVKNNEH